jgi:hypothetical protein
MQSQNNETGLLGQDRQNRTDMTGQQGQDIQDRITGQVHQEGLGTAGKGQLEHGSQNWTENAGQTEWDR